MWLVQSRVTLSPRMGRRCENRAVLQTLPLLSSAPHGWCQLSPLWGCPRCCSPSLQESLGRGCRLGVQTGSRVDVGSCSQPGRAVLGSRSIIPASSGAGALVEPAGGQEEVVLCFVGMLTAPDSVRAMQRLHPDRQSCQAHLEQLVTELAVLRDALSPCLTSQTGPLLRGSGPGSAGRAVGTATHTAWLLLEPGHAAENCQAGCPARPAAPG